jgi:YgiT-type zinc finger domain-containing protein
MICPNCGKEIIPRKEDDSFSYDGPAGNAVHISIVYVCPECDEIIEEYEPNDWNDMGDPEHFEDR